MKCSYCAEDIDQDSFFCDQCGEEVLCCESCLEPGIGKFCKLDGGNILPASQLRSADANMDSHVVARTQVYSTSDNQAGKVEDFSINASAVPALKLINKNLNLSLKVLDQQVLGRTSGAFVSQLSMFDSISGKHALFSFKHPGGWHVKDLGSTNGTKYSKISSWDSVPFCSPDYQQKIEHNAYLLISNIEFLIHIDQHGDVAGQSTRRI